MLLEEVARVGVPVTPAEVNTSLDLPKPTIHRLFATLEAEGYLQRAMDGRGFIPGRRMKRIAANILSTRAVDSARVAILRALADKVGETCNIATPGREAMVYLDRVETKWPLRIQLPVGSEVPFHCTASGKMFLSTLKPAHLDRWLASGALTARTSRTLVEPDALREELGKVRENGYATDDEEFMPDMTALAVPIADDMGRLVSTLSIHAPVQRQPISRLLGNLALLRSSAAELSGLLVSDQV
ncbi:MAG: IclR family transcriptional regulator [Pseudomonadota bacterium]